MDIIVCGEPGKELRKKKLTVKHIGSSVMVWGCVAVSKVGKLPFIDGIMNKHIYVNIL
jgi:hypothetical protein